MGRRGVLVDGVDAMADVNKKKHGPKCGGKRGCKKGDVTGNNSVIVE